VFGSTFVPAQAGVKQVLEAIKYEQRVALAQIAEQLGGRARCPANERPRLSPIAETIWLAEPTTASATNATPSANVAV
jgi:hypothetical protein